MTNEMCVTQVSTIPSIKTTLTLIMIKNVPKNNKNNNKMCMIIKKEHMYSTTVYTPQYKLLTVMTKKTNTGSVS